MRLAAMDSPKQSWTPINSHRYQSLSLYRFVGAAIRGEVGDGMDTRSVFQGWGDAPGGRELGWVGSFWTLRLGASGVCLVYSALLMYLAMDFLSVGCDKTSPRPSWSGCFRGSEMPGMQIERLVWSFCILWFPFLVHLVTAFFNAGCDKLFLSSGTMPLPLAISGSNRPA
jgi:hypothetical protein